MTTPASIILSKGAIGRGRRTPPGTGKSSSVSFGKHATPTTITHFSDVDVLDEPAPAIIKKLSALDVATATLRTTLSDPAFASGLGIMTNKGTILFLAAPSVAMMDGDTKEVLVCNLDDQVGSKHPVAIDTEDLTKGTILLVPAAAAKTYEFPASGDSANALEMIDDVPDTSLVDQIEWPYKDPEDYPVVAYIRSVWPIANKGALEHNKPAPTPAAGIKSSEQTYAEVITTCFGWLHQHNAGSGLHHDDTKIFKPTEIDVNIFDGATIADNVYTKPLLLDPINDGDILLSHQRKMDRVEQASFAFTQWSNVSTPVSHQQSDMTTPTNVTTPDSAASASNDASTT
jgi:hypothetical protein